MDEFYENKNILITGTTGFLGKALLERIVFRFKPLNIYILIRGDAKNRFLELKKSSVWCRTKNFKSIIPISGDIEKDGLGISQEDKNLIMKNPLDIVFHCAASVEFNLPLKDSININVYGALKLYDFIVQCAPKAHFVHVSTAYVGSMLEEPSKRLTDEEIGIGLVSGNMTKDWPNTYTWSKTMCEILLERKMKLKLSIVRPSIIANAYSEPAIGWGDSKDALIAFLLAHGHGLLRVAPSKKTHILDVIPVDYVVNTLISVGYRGDGFYHSTTSDVNPCKLKTIGDISKKHFNLHPPKKQIRRVMSFYMPYNLLYDSIHNFQHGLDKKYLPINIQKILLMHKKLIFNMKHFLQHGYLFQVKRTKELEDIVNDDRFPLIFDIDMKDYINRVCFGITKYVLKEKIGDNCLCMVSPSDIKIMSKI